MNSRGAKELNVDDVADVIARLSNKVARLQEEIYALKGTETGLQRNLRHVNDKDDKGRAKRVTRFTRSSATTTNDKPTTPGRREKESRESKRNFSHEPLSCLEGEQGDWQRKCALFNASCKNRPQAVREETDDDKFLPVVSDSTSLFEGRNTIKCKIIRKRISRGVQYEEPHCKRKNIVLSCFQSQNLTNEQSSTKKISENGKCNVSIQCHIQRSSEPKPDNTTQVLPWNMDETRTTVSRTDNEGDAHRYAGVEDRRNRPPASKKATVPHHRSEINEEVKATLTRADKRRRRSGLMVDRSNSKSRDAGKINGDEKDATDTNSDKKKKSLPERKRKAEKVIDAGIEKRKNDETRKTSLATEKRKTMNVINTAEEAKKRTLTTSKRGAGGSKNVTVETKKNDDSKMKNLPKEKKKKGVMLHESKDKDKTRKTSLPTAKNKKVHIEDKKNVNRDGIKKKSWTRKDVKIKSNSSDSQYRLIKGKLNECTKGLYRLIRKVSRLV